MTIRSPSRAPQSDQNGSSSRMSRADSVRSLPDAPGSAGGAPSLPGSSRGTPRCGRPAQGGPSNCRPVPQLGGLVAPVASGATPTPVLRVIRAPSLTATSPPRRPLRLEGHLGVVAHLHLAAEALLQEVARGGALHSTPRLAAETAPEGRIDVPRRGHHHEAGLGSTWRVTSTTTHHAGDAAWCQHPVLDTVLQAACRAAGCASDVDAHRTGQERGFACGRIHGADIVR